MKSLYELEREKAATASVPPIDSERKSISGREKELMQGK